MSNYDKAHAAGFNAAIAEFHGDVHPGNFIRAIAIYLAHMRPVIERQAAEAMRAECLRIAGMRHLSTPAVCAAIRALPLPGDPT